MRTEVHFGMRLQDRHLLLQLVWIGPVVVAFAERHIAAPDQRLQEGLRDVDPLRILVLRLVHAPDQVRVAALVFADGLRRAVGRGIVVHQDLDAPRRLLRDEALERIADIVRVIVGHADDGDHDLIHRSRQNRPASRAARPES